MEFPVIQTPNSIALMLDNRYRLIDSTHANFAAVKAQLKVINDVDGGDETVLQGRDILPALEEEINKLRGMLDIPSYIERLTEGNVTITDKGVLVRGMPVAGVIVDRMMQMLQEDFDVRPMMRFLDRVHDNPDQRARTDLYAWLESGNMPITSDGCFLAYKYVRQDYMDCYTGKIDNRVGAKPTMPRDQVDSDPHNECSSGLHFCSYGYLGGSSGYRYMVLKVKPEDVVAIPTDHNRQKGRAWTYEVIGEVPAEELAGRRIEQRAVVDSVTVHVKVATPKDADTLIKRALKSKNSTIRRLKKQKKATTTGNRKFSRKQALRLVEKHGQREAARRTGIPRTTLQHWAK